MEQAAAATEAKSTVKKKPKKVVKKAASAKKAAPATNTITLSEVCKGIKGMAPRRARRILRTAKVKNPGRWTWAKGSGDQKKVEKLLKDADADE